MSRSPVDHDALMAAALDQAGATIVRDAQESFLERNLDAALASAVDGLWPGVEIRLRKKLPLPDWEPVPAGRRGSAEGLREADLQVVPPGAEAPVIVSEQKIWDFDASLFDLAKLLTFLTTSGDDPPSAYLCGGGQDSHFDPANPGAALYAPGRREWSVVELVGGDWGRAWRKHIGEKHGAAAPRRLPHSFTTRLVHQARVPAFEHELRLVRVEVEPGVRRVHLSQGELLQEMPPKDDPATDARLTAEMVAEQKARAAAILQGRACPACGEAALVPIVYGMPTPELEEEASADEVVLGGCMVVEGQPTRQCRACGHQV